MSKVEILEQLPRLSPPDRHEIMTRLWALEERDLLGASQPSVREKVLLDEALDAFARSPDGGRPWREVLTELRSRRAP